MEASEEGIRAKGRKLESTAKEESKKKSCGKQGMRCCTFSLLGSFPSPLTFAVRKF
jgi:hypothetical protein